MGRHLTRRWIFVDPLSPTPRLAAASDNPEPARRDRGL
jgi:hypothetical protein